MSSVNSDESSQMNPSAAGAQPAPKPSKKKRSSQQISNAQIVLGDTPPGEHDPSGAHHGEGGGTGASTFRNVSACNRCRLRKNRCDQKLPACTSCEKAHVRCVGYDPVSKREIPRSYVFYLESRLQILESILQANGIPCPPAEDLTVPPSAHTDVDPPTVGEIGNENAMPYFTGNDAMPGSVEPLNQQSEHNMEQDVGGVDVQGVSAPRSHGPRSGMTFANVVFAAVKSSVSGTQLDRGGGKSSKSFGADAAAGSSTMRDSIFGLHAKPTLKPAPFPDMVLARHLVDLYFEHSNPQIPTLHRGQYMDMMDRVYATEEQKRKPRELFMLNIVFAIGSGIIMDGSSSSREDKDSDKSHANGQESPQRKRQKTLGQQQYQPEEYHAAAVIHLDSFSGSPPAIEAVGPGLEELQAVLLLAGFALLRPVAPGLWYIVGVAVRLAVDLGLHFEDQDSPGDVAVDAANRQKGFGHRQWTRDLRRRLWWCVYSFDRLVSMCVGRPVSVSDQVVTSEFPSLLEDKYITTSGFMDPPAGMYGSIPSYKQVSHHYFRLRLLQSEILQVLQHRQAQLTRATGINQDNRFMHTNLPSPFLAGFMSFRDWRIDIDRRLWEWKESAPTQSMTGVQFTPLFLELNYWQAVVMLYRQSLSVPAPLAGELDASTTDDVHSPGHLHAEEGEDEEMVFLKVAEAGQRVLRIYRQLHRVYLVNYTYLATHHLFMCGISFLYAIWHSTLVRSKLTLDDVDFTVLAATSVLGDLIEKCPPAEACRDAFKRMSKATISMCMATTGFGAQAMKHLPRVPKPEPMYFRSAQQHSLGGNLYSQTPPPPLFNQRQQQQQQQQQARPAPRFDMELKDLFSDDDLADRSSPSLTRPLSTTQSTSQQDRTFIKPERNNTSGPPSVASGSPWGGPSAQLQQLQQQQQHSPIDPALQNSPMSYAQSLSGLSEGVPGMQNQGQAQASAAGHPGLWTAESFGSLDFLDEFAIPPGVGNVAGQLPLGVGPGAGQVSVAGGRNDQAGMAMAMPNNGQATSSLDWDLGFGAGGLAFDGGAGGSWDQDGFDLFGGFFFGNGNGGSGGGAGV